jgi:hypothetical protein
MGPLLFNLALQTPLEETTAAVLDAHLVAVHDEVTLVDMFNRVEALYRALETHTRLLSLRVLPSKYAVYYPTATDAAALAQKLSLVHEAEGIVVAGSAISSPSFVQTLGSKTARSVIRKVEKLMELPLELQHKHLLLQLSMVPRLTYLLRTGPLDPDAGSMDALVREAARVFQQAGADMVGPFATRTAEMHLGLPIPSSTLSEAARLSSAALTQAALRQPPSIFRPFDGPHCAILRHTWVTLKTTAEDLCSPETATLQAALQHGTLAQAQHSFGHHEAAHL